MNLSSENRKRSVFDYNVAAAKFCKERAKRRQRRRYFVKKE
jgi:hypothetical protein